MLGVLGHRIDTEAGVVPRLRRIRAKTVVLVTSG